MLDLIDQMRVAIPEEIKKAQQIITQRDRIMAQAKEEANRTLALAREKAEKQLKMMRLSNPLRNEPQKSLKKHTKKLQSPAEKQISIFLTH